MFLEILIGILVGCLFGIITGLIPGIHVNLISLIALSFSPILLQYISPIALCVFIIGMAVTHSFLDSIPSIYLGAPDEAQALSVLPGHKLLMKGEGHNAIKLTLIGSFFSLLLCLFLAPLFMLIVKFVYPIIKNYIGFILIGVMVFMIFKDNKRWYNLLIFTMAGTLGLIILSTSNIENPLFPLLSGLFGFSVLLISLMQDSKIPEQNYNAPLGINKSEISKSTIGATIVGFIASFLPGLGSSQAAIIAQQFMKKISDKGFLVLVGGINTVNFSLSLVTLYILSKARNGAVVVISQIIPEVSTKTIAIFFIAALIAGSLAVILAVNISKVFSKFIVKVNYKILIISILSFITILTFYFSGIIGLIILITATAVGLVATELGVGKNHAMGCLILPVILYFIL